MKDAQAGPAPHQLGGVLGLLGAEDERELLQPVPELLAHGELAPDEGQGPQLEHPVKEPGQGAVQAVPQFSCLPGSGGPSAAPTPLTRPTSRPWRP